MNRYPTTLHRAAFGLAAFAMTALTLLVMVILPATLERPGVARASLAAAAPATTDSGAATLRIEVVGEREQETALAPGRQVAPKQGTQG